MQLHPDYPVIEGRYQMTSEWSVHLPSKFNRRFEDDSLLIWKPGFTIWTIIWGNDDSESAAERVESLKEGSSPEAFDAVTEIDGGVIRHAYRLKEESDDEREPAFYCFAFGESGHVQMAMYFDAQEDLATAQAIWRSLAEVPEK